jgi:hypothetical protein
LEFEGREIFEIAEVDEHRALTFNDTLEGHNTDPAIALLKTIPDDQKNVDLIVKTSNRNTVVNANGYSFFFVFRVQTEQNGSGYVGFGKTFIAFGVYNST